MDPSLSPQVEQREDEHPHEIDEVPVEAHDFDGLVVAPPAREEAALAAVVVASPDLARDDEQEDHADRHVRAVEPRDHEEARSELRRTPRVSPGPHALHDELGPLERVHADEGCAEGGRYEHEYGGLLADVAVAEVDRNRHGAAAAAQHEGLDRDQDER